MQKAERCRICESKEILRLDFTEDFYLMNLDQIVNIIYCVCQSCQFIFQGEYVGDEFLHSYYQNSLALRREDITDIEAIVYKKQADFMSQTISLYGRNVLEVGADTGQFLMYLKYCYNCNVYFEELSDDAKKILLERTIIKEFCKTKTKTKLDIVVLRHVFEHIYDINGFLSYVKEILSEDGVLFIEVPDWSYLDAHTDPYIFEHINQFSVYNLNLLLKKTGFVTERLELDTIEESRSTPNRVLRVIAKPTVVSSLNSADIKFDVERHHTFHRRHIDCVNKYLDKIGNDEKIAISPASHYTFEFMLNSNLGKKDLVGIFDIDERKKGRVFKGIEVKLSQSVCDFEPDIIMVLTIGAYKDEIAKFFREMNCDAEVITLNEIVERYS